VKAANAATIPRASSDAQVTTPAQVARFKEMKVIASMQPSQWLYMNMRGRRTGWGRSERRQPMRGGISE